MVRSSKGIKIGTRRKLRQKKRIKFKSESFLKTFKLKDRVVIKINPFSHKGMPLPKLKGKTGEIIEKRGNSFVVKIRVGNFQKKIIARSEHLAHASKNK
jgi:large subunit ribosomal protein L21e